MNPSKAYPLVYDLKLWLNEKHKYLNPGQLVVYSPFGKLLNDTDSVISSIEEMNVENPFRLKLSKLKLVLRISYITLSNKVNKSQFVLYETTSVFHLCKLIEK